MPRSKFPDSLQVFGAEIKIIERADLMFGEEKVDGLFIPDTKIIMIEKSLPKEEKIQTLIHELGHAVIWRVSINQSGLSPELEEVIVDTYATMMTEVFNLRFRKV